MFAIASNPVTLRTHFGTSDFESDMSSPYWLTISVKVADIEFMSIIFMKLCAVSPVSDRPAFFACSMSA